MVKTNAARILDKHKINYELISYEVDENDLSATTLAAKIGQDINSVFKTLVLRGDKTGVIVCIIPGNEELDLKKTAKISGNKSVEMVAVKEIPELTGYIRGGCSPVGMKKRYPMYIHESCMSCGLIFVSAGIRGLQLKVRPEDLIKVSEAQVSNLI